MSCSINSLKPKDIQTENPHIEGAQTSTFLYAGPNGSAPKWGKKHLHYFDNICSRSLKKQSVANTGNVIKYRNAASHTEHNGN